MPWASQNWEKSGFFTPSHASFHGKLCKFVRDDSSGFDSVFAAFQHFKAHHFFDMSQSICWFVLWVSFLSGLFTESQLEVSEESST